MVDTEDFLVAKTIAENMFQIKNSLRASKVLRTKKNYNLLDVVLYEYMQSFDFAFDYSNRRLLVLQVLVVLEDSV